MVAAIQHYYIRAKGDDRGPFTLNQVAAMWCSGALTADALYRLTNVENWTPLSQLDDTLRFVWSSHPVEAAEQGTNTPAPMAAAPTRDEIHPSLLVPGTNIPMASFRSAKTSVTPTSGLHRTPKPLPARSKYGDTGDVPWLFRPIVWSLLLVGWLCRAAGRIIGVVLAIVIFGAVALIFILLARLLLGTL